MLILLALLVAAVVAVLAYASSRPDRFQIVRSITVNATPEQIYPLIENFNEWRRWSPYDKRDPEMKREISGPAGKGARYRWEGNGQVGAGDMEILETDPPSRLVVALRMEKPMKADNEVVFTLAPSGAGTEVSWAMSGTNSLLSKVIGLFINIDRMVGADFEKGLAALKSEAEK